MTAMQPKHFIGETITVEFDEPPALAKAPPCPDRIVWRGKTYVITELLEEWRNFERRGRMARNMRPSHLATAAGKGSRGVGRFYFRVRLDTGQVFDLYYDRTIKSVDDTLGIWTLFRELEA